MRAGHIGHAAFDGLAKQGRGVKAFGHLHEDEQPSPLARVARAFGEGGKLLKHEFQLFAVAGDDALDVGVQQVPAQKLVDDGLVEVGVCKSVPCLPMVHLAQQLLMASR